MEYLAKSNPRETLEEHTLKLIENYDLLRQYYPGISVDWEILLEAVKYHDMGKINPIFQERMRRVKTNSYENKNRSQSEDGQEIHHGYLSIGFIDTEKILDSSKDENLQRERLGILLEAVFFHHNRALVELKEIKQAAEKFFEKDKIIDFKDNRLRGIAFRKIPSRKYFSGRHRFCGLKNTVERDSFLRYVMVKGLLNRIDYAASAYVPVEYPNDFLEERLHWALHEIIAKEKPNPEWNTLQKYMMGKRSENLIVTAQTAMGKTEAALLWIGNHKGFFTLPLRSAINSIYKRILKYIGEKPEEKLGLLHSDIISQYLMLQEEKAYDFDLQEYLTHTRQFAMPLTVCTIDQILDFVYLYNGCESKMATLAYSKLIIDEIQMYNPQLLATIIIALDWVVQLGGKFAILTATMPPFLVEHLKSLGVRFEEKAFVNRLIRHSLKVVHRSVEENFIVEKYNKNKVLVICNTVKEAQKLYAGLREMGIEKVHLFHSGFIMKHRQKLENELFSFGQNESKEEGIWICTQVAEASLDIDFDILITELSDLNGLFQRMGRCFRSRKWDREGYNCYVFDGGDKKVSGIGTVIDRSIFQLSKETIKTLDGPLSEQTKMELIENLYTKENLEDSQFYEDYQRYFHYLDTLINGEKLQSEVEKEFRNIQSVEIIPLCIYEENQDIIRENIEILQRTGEEIKDIKERMQKKIQARNQIKQYMLNIPRNVFDKIYSRTVELTKRQKLFIVDVAYDEKTGLQFSSKNMKDKGSSIDITERMI